MNEVEQLAAEVARKLIARRELLAVSESSSGGLISAALLAVTGCKKSSDQKEAAPKSGLTVGLVTDIGGRGDQSFNDSALRGLEVFAAAKQFKSGSYVPMAPEARAAMIPPELAGKVTPVEDSLARLEASVAIGRVIRGLA